MRAKTILTVLFVFSLGIAAIVALHAIPQKPEAAGLPPEQAQILVAAATLSPSTLLREQDVTWAPINRAPEQTEFVRPPAALIEARPELDQQARAEVYGAAVRGAISDAAASRPIAKGTPIRRNELVKPGDRDFLQVVLSPGARAIAIPVATGGASTGLLYPGDRVDVILTQQFKNGETPLTKRSVGETVVENLRVLAIDPVDAKNPTGGSAFGRTVTLEVTPVQAEAINVAAELGKLSLTLRSLDSARTVAAAATPGARAETPVKATWAGDVSPALGGVSPPGKLVTAEQPPVLVFHGANRENIKQ
jgi:pilus assembly protein CpaB